MDEAVYPVSEVIRKLQKDAMCSLCEGAPLMMCSCRDILALLDHIGRYVAGEDNELRMDAKAAHEISSELNAESIARGPKLVTLNCPRCGSDLIETRLDAFCCMDCDAYIGGPDGLAVRPRPA